MKNLFDVTDKVILVTGGNRGIGYVLAVGLQNAGANVTITSRKDTVMNMPMIFADLSNVKERAYVIGKMFSKHGRIDVLINNAGAIAYCPALVYPLEQWDNDIELMLTAVFDLSQQVGSIMERQGSGKIINIASISSFLGARGIIGYVAAKHGLIGVTKSMAIALAPHGINVNAIAPGYIETDMYDGLVKRVGSESALLERVSAGRAGNPTDLLGATIFLASDASNYVHGHTLVVDGGMMIK